jgi:neuron navigator 2
VSGSPYSSDFNPAVSGQGSVMNNTSLYHTASPGLASKLSSSTDNILHGSSLSLGSNSSSLYSTAEEIQAHEIYKLRRELEAAQAKIMSLSSHLNTNAHVVFAFEQSLVNMTHRLQRLAATTDQKDAELNEMRVIIDSLKQHSGLTQQATSDTSSISESVHPMMRRHMSSDSVVSGSSQQLFIMSQADIDRKKKKHRNWLTSFGKAFSRKKKTGSMSDADSDISCVYADAPLTVSICPPSHLVVPTSVCSDARLSINGTSDAAVLALQEQLHEKDLRLTDVQLEALSSAHQLQQLQDTIIRMQNEMLSLRIDNERLNQLVSDKNDFSTTCTNSGQGIVQSSVSTGGSFDNEITCGALSSSVQSQKSSSPNLVDPTKTQGGVGFHDNSLAVTLSVQLKSDNKIVSVFIGKLLLDRTLSWDRLSAAVYEKFNEYLLELDASTSLGLSEDSIHCFTVGDLVVTKGTSKPDLLPCGYLIGENNNICISLKDAEQKSVDSLSFDTLVPKSIVQRYVSLLLEHRRIILCGSSGTGKTYLARRLAEHLILRSGKCLNAEAIATFTVDNKSSRELRPYLSSVAEKCDEKSNELPHVIILDGLHHIASSLSDTFSGFLTIDYHASPYIIGVMNQAMGSTTNLQLHHNFRWVLCANHMEPVQGFLGRYLRRRLLEAKVLGSAECQDLEHVVEWIPQVWQHLNKLLETHNSTDVTIGPRLFLSCPMNICEVPVWFADLWNYSLVPYLLDAMREGIQTYGIRAAWDDPADWIIATCPWTKHSEFDWSTIQRIRPEDIGCDGPAMTGRSLSTRTVSETTDPLMTMLLQLQDAASCSSVQMINSKLSNTDN